MRDERTILEGLIEETMTRAVEEVHEQVRAEFERNTAGGMEHFIGITGILGSEVTENEDHIIRGED